MNRNALVRQEISASVIRSIVSAIPYIGPALNEALFETRSRIKQQRINRFFELLMAYFEEHGNTGVDLSECETEEFGDLLERTLLNVSRNRSEAKAIWFRNILINQITTNHEIEKSELFAELLDSLKDKQVKILEAMRTISHNGVWQANAERLLNEAKLKELMSELDLRRGTGQVVSQDRIEAEVRYHKGHVAESEAEMASYAHVFDCAHFGCSQDEFQYYLQGLTNRALLIDLSHKYEATTLSVLKTTHLGEELLEYIMLSSEPGA